MHYWRATLVWILMMLAEMVHAVFRNALLTPAVGDFLARQISVFTGSLIIFGITWVFIRWLNAPGRRSQLLVGLFWVVLTLCFEFSLGLFVFHYDRTRILSDYNVLNGGLMPLGLLAMGLSPFAAARLRRTA